MNGIKANARTRVEQDVDLVLKNMKLKILGQPHDEILMMTDSRYKNYKENEDRIFHKTAYCLGNVLEKQVVSNTAKFFSLSNYLMLFSAACMENWENTQELSKRYLLTGKTINFQKWRN